MKFYKTTLISILIAIWAVPVLVHAAVITFDTPKTSFAQGEEFRVTVSLNTQGESINAVEGTIVYPSNLFEVEDIQEGNSVMSFWITPLRVTSPGMISFSGIVPGGYDGPSGELFTLIVKTKAKGDGSFSLTNIKTIHNNADATEAKASYLPLSLSIGSRSVNDSNKFTIIENNPPERFFAQIAQNDEVFDGKFFVVFATNDKGSGIDHYEVREGIFGKYIRAESPYVLVDQTGNTKVFVKAVDKNNNERVSIAYPLGWAPWYKDWRVLVAILLVLGALGFFTRHTLLRKH